MGGRRALPTQEIIKKKIYDLRKLGNIREFSSLGGHKAYSAKIT